MRQKVTAVLFSLVMMIVVVHHAIPHHHHHEGMLIHDHEINHDHSKPDPTDDHRSEPCVVRSLDLSIPRVQHSGKPACLPVIMEYTPAKPGLLQLRPAEALITFLPDPSIPPPRKGLPATVPSRAPPGKTEA